MAINLSDISQNMDLVKNWSKHERPASGRRADWRSVHNYEGNKPCVAGKWGKWGGHHVAGKVEGCYSREIDPWCATEVDSREWSTDYGDWKKWGYCNMTIAACNPEGEVGSFACQSTLPLDSGHFYFLYL